MNNKYSDLNNYLFEQLERINDDDLNPEELDAAIKKAEAVGKVAETIIKNGELALKTANFLHNSGATWKTSTQALIGTDLRLKNEEIQ